MRSPKLANDSLIFALAKFVTLGTGIVSAMILSRTLDLRAYGSYAQGNQIVTLGALMTVFGLADGVNFFYNHATSSAQSADYVNTIFSVQCLIGLVAGLSILVFQGNVTSYFGNPQLGGLYLYLAFRPLLTNLVSSLQVLMVSIARAKMLALRTIAISLLKLGVVLVVSFVCRDVRIIFAALLVMEGVTVVWFWSTFTRERYAIHLTKPKLSLLRPILALCVPMGVFVMANSLSKEMGKLVIGGRMTVDWYAIYANCASPLPFDVISSSFLVVMIPVLTRLLAERRFDRALLMFRHYVTIGYLTTVAVAAGALLVAPEAVRFLYGEKYVPGVAVFQLNLVATMFQFANLSLVLSASGRTKVLMLVSICSLAINAVLAPASFDLLGFVGPAVATCLVSLLTTVSLFLLSLRVLNGKVRDVLEPRRVLHFVVVSAVLFVVVGALRLVLVSVGVNYVAVLTMCGGLYVALSVWMFRRELKDAISLLNQAEWSMA